MADFNLIRSVLSILNKKEQLNIYLLVLLDLIIGLCDVIFLGGLLLIINLFTNAGKASHFIFLDLLYKNYPLFLITGFCFLFGLKNCIAYLISKHQHDIFYTVATRLSEQNLWRYLKNNYHEFIQIDSSVYTRKISQQPIEFSNYILTNLQQIVSQSILIFVTFAGLLFYKPGTFFSLFLLLLIPVSLLVYLIKNKLKQARSSTKIASQMAIQYLNESLSGYIESNIYGKNKFFVGRYLKQQKQLNENIAATQTLQGLPPRLIEVFAVLGFFILIMINRFTAGGNGLQLIDIGVFMAAAYKIIPGVVKILNSTAQIKTYDFVLKDLMYFNHNLENTGAAPAITSISFDQISFNYGPRAILNDLSFEIELGDFMGISAISGKGKTTIVNLLLGFLEPGSGTICINKTSATATQRLLYQQRVSYVKQQPFFINDTIIKNITLTDDSFDEKKLNEAIAFCQLTSMLNQYAEGSNKIITENGRNISGGQRQRLMLARAIYHDFDLLILDEPFSEVDTDTETEILGKLKILAAGGKMIVMITHNKQSLTYCNKIISLNE